MSGLKRDILECIGNTSLLALRKIVPSNGARVLLKVESENPTGSEALRIGSVGDGACRFRLLEDRQGLARRLFGDGTRGTWNSQSRLETLETERGRCV